jgi:argininosuccinate lyase
MVLAALSMPVTDLGRLAHDLILMSSDELRWVTLSHEVTTGSSIMPQKRNPDVLELVRATAARLRSRVGELAGVYGGLPSGYHRDLQLTKGPFLDGVSAAADVFRVFAVVLDGLTVHPERCRTAVQPATAATEEVYRRIGEGVPFRTAYREVGADPAGAVEGEPAEAWRGRRHAGAPGAVDLAPYRQTLAAGHGWIDDTRRRLLAVWQRLP